MSESLPSVTVLIAARPDQADIKAVTAARKLDYPADKLEILVARGRQPSVQRNEAVRAARGELIYFLDDDSTPPPDNLDRAVKHFADPKAKMAGGPNLCPPDAPRLEHIFAIVHASFAFGPSRARYVSLGTTRDSSEKELILCNLLTRRDTMIELGGFNEALYPNEENALMDEIQKRGGRLVYDPALYVYRRPRHSLGAFFRMLKTYGRGRAEQFRVHPTLGSALNFAPPLFLIYLIALPFVFIFTRFGPILSLPFALYVLIVLLQTAVLIAAGPPRPARPPPGAPPHPGGFTHFINCLIAMPLIGLALIIYGYGFWLGLFSRLDAKVSRERAGVVLESVPLNRPLAK